MTEDVGSSTFFVWEKHTVKGTSQLDDRVYNHRAVLIGDKIYVFGGHRKTYIYALDYRKRRWDIVTMDGALIRQCQFHTATLVDDSVHIIGGSVRGTPRVPVVRFDSVTNEMDTISLRGHSRLVMDNHVAEYFPQLHEVLVYGRFKEKEDEANELLGYDPETAMCRSLNAKGKPPSLRIQMVSCPGKHSMYVFAGGRRVGTRKVAASALYELKLVGTELNWSSLGKFQEPTVRFSSLTHVHGRLFLYGGLARMGEAQDLRIFELGSTKWQKIWFTDEGEEQPEETKFLAVGHRPQFPSCHTTTYASGRLLVVGGFKMPMAEFTSISAVTSTY